MAVEALRAHLSLDRMDLLGHSAAGDLATLYAAAFPQRVAHLILLTPGLDAVGVEEIAAAGARWFPNATVTVQPGAAHFPWLDDPAFFTAAITSFLS